MKAVLGKYASSAKKVPVNDAGDYTMQHTSFSYLFGPDGEPLVILPTDKGGAAVGEELARWVR